MAFVLSSVSGNLISAASAGYAPTNSADVSAIASAYQVVSATATQLYAGTNYVTSINETTISAERAGRAGNATLATSAYYDTNSRFISSLPDSAAVSAIASAYAESAASSKQDTLAFAYNTADQISSINGSALGGMDEAAVSAIASAYAESAASGKLDSSAFNSGDFYSTSNPSGFITGVDLSPYQLTADMSSYIPTSMSSDFQQVTGMSSYVPYSSIGYNTASAISGINGSALAGTTYSAGTGIDITDDVISVETPVDIVAGPGIVVDNPDGNTLRVSMAADYEVVLWSGTYSGSVNDSNFITLSEDPRNFDTIEISNGGNYKSKFRFDGASDSWSFMQNYADVNGTKVYCNRYSIDAGNKKVTCKACNTFVINSNNSITNWQAASMGVGEVQLSKVVGIHRTASN